MFDPISHFSDRPARSLIGVLQEGIQTLFQLLLLCLLILGLGGLVYKAVGPDGWLESTLDLIWSSHPTSAILGGLALLIGATWLPRRLEKLPLFGRGGDWLVYGCLAVGLFFALRLIATGGL
jgi:hypothetical protein